MPNGSKTGKISVEIKRKEGETMMNLILRADVDDLIFGGDTWTKSDR